VKKRTTEIKKTLLTFIIQTAPTWADIKNKFTISTGSISNYLKEWIREGVIKRMIFDIDNKVHYVIWKLPEKEKLEVIKDLEKAIELFEHLKKLGLFSKGITDKEILEVMKDTRFMSFGYPFPDVDIKKLDLIRLVAFLSKAMFTLTHYLYSGVDVKLKIEGNPDEQIKELQDKIKELKTNKQKYF